MNAEESKWMAWELGLGDGLGKRVAVLPVADGGGTLATREFLLVYPQVEKPVYGPSAGAFVAQPNGSRMPLTSWLGVAWPV